MSEENKHLVPLEGLMETLELLVAQATAYERALPPDNYPARAAVAALGELARQALNDAQDLGAFITVSDRLPHNLTPRETEVLSLAARGLTNKEIAYRLGISDRTVQFHMNSIFTKTETNSRTQAVALGLQNKWI